MKVLAKPTIQPDATRMGYNDFQHENKLIWALTKLVQSAIELKGKPKVWDGKKVYGLWIVDGIFYEVRDSHPAWVIEHLPLSSEKKARLDPYEELPPAFYKAHPTMARIGLGEGGYDHEGTIYIQADKPTRVLDNLLLEVIDKRPDTENLIVDFSSPNYSGRWNVNDFLEEGSSKLARKPGLEHVASAATTGKEEFDLGDGYLLRLEPHPLATDNDSWGFYKKLDFSENRLGFFTIYTSYDTGPAVGAVSLAKGGRGLGLARKAIPKLVEYYGSLSSDPQGNTSDDAAKMWQALKAPKIPTNKNTKGWMYQLKEGVVAYDATIQEFVDWAGKSYYSYEKLMEKGNDEYWADERDNQNLTDDDRETWARDREREALDDGDPSMHFDTAKVLPTGTWLIHFTDANPMNIVKEGFHGRELEVLGLTTHYKSGARPGPFALAFKSDDVGSDRHQFGKYGKNAVLFQAKQAAEAYHWSDEEDQVVFVADSAYNLFPVYGDSDMLELYSRDNNDVLYSCDRNQSCIDDMIKAVEKSAKAVVATSDPGLLTEFVNKAKSFRSRYGYVDKVKEYRTPKMTAVDLHVVVGPEQENTEVWHIDIKDGKFHWLDFNVDVELGSSIQEALQGIEMMMQEEAPSKMLVKK